MSAEKPPDQKKFGASLAAAAAAHDASLSVTAGEDPLLNCLSILTRLLDRPHTPEALRAGLPIPDQGMTPGLFIRSAKRVGIAARVLKRRLGRISPHTLPCVLLLKDRHAVILTSLQGQTAKIITPESGGESSLPLTELEKTFSGYAIFARPTYTPDKRTAGMANVGADKSWFWGTIAQFRQIYVQVVVAAFFINLFMLASSLFIMIVYDRVVPNPDAKETLWVLALGVVIVFIFDFILRSIRAYFLDIASRGVDTIISARLFSKLMAIRMDQKPPSAGVLAGNMKEFETIREFFTSASVATLVDLPFVSIYLLVIFMIGGPLFIIPFLALPILILSGLLIQKPITGLIKESFKHSAQKAALLIEGITGLETIKTHRAEGYLQRKWESFASEVAKSTSKAHTFTALGMSITSLVANMSTVVTVIYGVYLIQSGSITMGALIGVVILSGRVIAPMSQLASLLTRFNQARQSYAALSSFMVLGEERDPEKTYIHRPSFAGAVTFKNVSFSYPNRNEEVLRDISFHLKAGEKVALVGPIGSGKSTIEKLFLGLYEPQKGSVMVDGADIRQIDPADLRRNMGVVSQDVQLFYGTVRENITLGNPEVDDNALMRAAAIAGVGDFLRHDEQGFDRIIGERGESLSGGQRQAVAIARGLVTDPPILILDEPTSSFDPGSERRFLERFAKVTKNKTLVLITHRTALLALVDRIIVMNNGVIAADGPRDQILKGLKEGKIKS